MSNFIWIDGWWPGQDGTGQRADKGGCWQARDLLPPRVRLENLSTRTRRGKMEGHWSQAERLCKTPLHSVLMPASPPSLSPPWRPGLAVAPQGCFAPPPAPTSRGAVHFGPPVYFLADLSSVPSTELPPSWGHCREWVPYLTSQPGRLARVGTSKIIGGTSDLRTASLWPLPSGLISSV